MLTLLAALEHHARVTPYKPAFLIACRGEWQQFSYNDLHEETERWARIWIASGAPPRAVVFIILQHCAEMYPAFLGAMRAGLIPSLMPFPTPKQDPDIYWHSHKALFDRVKPAAVLTYAALHGLVGNIANAGCAVLDIATASAPPGLALPAARDLEDPDATALLQHSSGTTGLKKGVALTWRQIRDHVEAYTQAVNASTEDRVASWLPIYHDMGLIAAFLMPVTIGAMVVSIDAFEWLAQPDMFLDTIARFRATLCWLPNFAFNHLVRTRDPDAQYDLSSLRAAIDCSEPCKSETLDGFERAFAQHGLGPNTLQVCYGMAENVFAITQTSLGQAPHRITVDRAALAERSNIVLRDGNSPAGARYVSCGRPIKGVELRITPMPPAVSMPGFARTLSDIGFGAKRKHEAAVGEIEVRSPYLFDGYYGNPDATQAALSGAWLKTGDIGFILDGELYVCGRAKEMLIVHGRNFYAHDIEELVNTLAGIKPGRVVAVGIHDPVTGSEEAVVLAETTLVDPAARAELDLAIRKRIFDVLNLSLRRVELAGEGSMVKTTSGKISRDENIKRFAKELVTP